MELILTRMEARFIRKWYAQETVAHYGDGEVILGEEKSILDKISFSNLGMDVTEKICTFNLTEMEILEMWSHKNFGIYEEVKLIEKLEHALAEEEKNFARKFAGE